MESNFKKFVNDNKGFIVFFLIWFLIHLIFFAAGNGRSEFWPFEGFKSFRLRYYGGKELFFYLIVPIVIWGLCKLVGKDSEKNIDENN